MNEAVILAMAAGAVGAVGGIFGGLVLVLLMTAKAVRLYPKTVVMPPPAVVAQAPGDLEQWARKHGYKLKKSWVDGAPCYRKGTGMLTSATEVRLADGHLIAQEIVNLLVSKRAFALNAPVLMAKPVRARKLKAVNQLLALWQMTPLKMDAPKLPPVPRSRG